MSGSVTTKRRYLVSKPVVPSLRIHKRAILPSALVVLTNLPLGRTIADSLIRWGYDVDLVDNGLAALKKIQAKDRYKLLITQLRVDHISGMALVMQLKKKRSVYAIGINNCGEICRSVALDLGFDLILDHGVDPVLICQYLFNDSERTTEGGKCWCQ